MSRFQAVLVRTGPVRGGRAKDFSPLRATVSSPFGGGSSFVGATHASPLQHLVCLDTRERESSSLPTLQRSSTFRHAQSTACSGTGTGEMSIPARRLTKGDRSPLRGRAAGARVQPLLVRTGSVHGGRAKDFSPLRATLFHPWAFVLPSEGRRMRRPYSTRVSQIPRNVGHPPFPALRCGSTRSRHRRLKDRGERKLEKIKGVKGPPPLSKRLPASWPSLTHLRQSLISFALIRHGE